MFLLEWPQIKKRSCLCCLSTFVLYVVFSLFLSPFFDPFVLLRKINYQTHSISVLGERVFFLLCFFLFHHCQQSHSLDSLYFPVWEVVLLPYRSLVEDFSFPRGNAELVTFRNNAARTWKLIVFDHFLFASSLGLSFIYFEPWTTIC